MNMKKLFLFLVPAVMLGMFAACEDTPEGDSENGTDVSIGVKANQIKIGSNITSFKYEDTLRFHGDMASLYPWYAYDEMGMLKPVTGTVMYLSLSIDPSLFGKEIDLSPNGIKKEEYEFLSFSMDMVSSNKQVIPVTIGKSGIQTPDGGYSTVMAGVIGEDSIASVFKSGKLVMNVDWSKKSFTFKIAATLWDGRDFQVYISGATSGIEYAFNMVPHTSTYQRYEYNPDKYNGEGGYDTIFTDLSAVDAAADKYHFGLMFTVEAADFSDDARFKAYKDAIAMYQDALSMIDGAQIQAGCIADPRRCEEGFALKLETWGSFGQLFLGYHKWKNTDSVFIDEGFIMTDDEIREAISKDYIEYVELEF